MQCVVADAEGAKVLLRNSHEFGKPVEDYRILTFFGDNVIASEGEQWRRHRRLTVGSFNEVSPLSQLVVRH